MSDIFQSGFDNIGARAVAEAQARADKYNQELTKREMLSQTEESLGGVKLFTSGRQIGENIVKNSKLKPYIKQQVKKLLKKKGDDVPEEDEAQEEGVPELPEAPIQLNPIGDIEPEVEETAEPAVEDLSLGSKLFDNQGLSRFGRIAKLRKARSLKNGMSEDEANEDMNNFIQQRQDVYNAQKARTINNAEEEERNAQEASQAEENESNEANAIDKARSNPVDEADKVLKDNEEDADADVGADAEKVVAKTAGEGEEISGLETFSSVLDEIPGLDILGLALGGAGLIGGLVKKAPKAIVPTIQSYSGASNQVGI